MSKQGGAVKQKRRGSRKKDPNAPKRALSAYMFFAQKKRQEILARQPELRTEVAKMGKIIGEAWAKLTPDDKRPFEDMASRDKVRYANAMEEYKKK